jgi:hypothetical protein
MVPGRLHAWQSPEAPPPHAVSQQTPSTHWPLTHSAAAVQLVPCGFFAAHSWPAQYVAGGHPAPHGMGQSTLVPLQVSAPPHTGSPGSPDGAGRHCPRKPGKSQRSHEPVQALAQHTPFAHAPLVHWAFEVQAWPLGRDGWQVPESQNEPMAHWRAEVQVVGHPPWPSQTKGAQVDAVPSGNTSHWPSRPICAHDSQAPEHDRLQQRPWAHTPEAQVLPDWQASPRGLATPPALAPPAAPPAATPPASPPPIIVTPPASPPPAIATPPAAPPARPPAAPPPAAEHDTRHTPSQHTKPSLHRLRSSHAKDVTALGSTQTQPLTNTRRNQKRTMRPPYGNRRSGRADGRESSRTRRHGGWARPSRRMRVRVAPQQPLDEGSLTERRAGGWRQTHRPPTPFVSRRPSRLRRRRCWPPP